MLHPGKGPNNSGGILFSETEMADLQDVVRSKSTVCMYSNCWIWRGAYSSGGYGAIKRSRHGTMKAHRVSFAAFYGSVPPKASVRHSCDNPGCVNPEHLLLGTHKDNMRDKMDRGRGGGGKKRKLDFFYLSCIRILRGFGYTQRRLAWMFGVTQRTICSNLKAIEKGMLDE